MRNPIAILACLLVAAWPGLSQAQERAPAFARDVTPVLTRSGCNSGACHGSFQGRGGFRLSLLGFDPPADFTALVQEGRGRRLNPAFPEHSLILRKPAGQMAHGGGRKLPADSEAYRRLHAWIVRGLPGPKPTDPALVKLEATPGELELKPDQTVQLQVRAVWSDKVIEDVPAWALYDSTHDHVASVTQQGLVRGVGPGQTAIMVRYLDQFAVVNVRVPYPANAAPPPPVAFTPANYIDQHLQTSWAKLGLQPAPLADDAEFLRRVSIDLIGTLPTPEDIRAFLASKDPSKRAKVIDQLLERSEYVDFWSLKWGDLLRAHRRALGEKGLKSFTAWLNNSLRDNKPADQFVRELLLAQGNLYANGPVAFYFVDQTPEDLAETTSQIFLGVRLQCAKCHHHPFEVWTQDDYYGLAAFFARIERKDTKEEGRYGGAQSIRLGPAGQVKNPASGQVAQPRLLGQDKPVPADLADPRLALADWLTAKSNPFFARNLVNRYWGYLFGRGLVEPIDDLRATNPASHPELLNALVKDFTDHGFDLKRLLRTMCNSRAYQLASELAPRRDREGVFFTHRQPRRLSAEVLLDAINQAAGVEENFPQLPPETRAIALPDSSVKSTFLDAFGKPKRTTTCECERMARPDLAQVLHLINSDKLHAKIADPKGRLVKWLEAKKTDGDIIEEMYLATLSRLPSARELETARRLVAEAPNRREGLEDLLWTLLNCAEFAFQH